MERGYGKRKEAKSDTGNRWRNENERAREVLYESLLKWLSEREQAGEEETRNRAMEREQAILNFDEIVLTRAGRYSHY